MNEILAAVKTGMVWVVAFGGIVLAFILARLIVSKVYEDAKKRGSVDVMFAMLIFAVPGIAGTYFMFTTRPKDWLALGLILFFSIIGAILVLVQARKKTYHRARNACAIAVWVGIYLGTMSALFVGHFLGFDTKMLLVTGLVTSILPSVTYLVVGRQVA